MRWWRLPTLEVRDDTGERIARLLELSQEFLLDRTAAGRIELERVHGCAELTHFVVQMRAGREPGHADVPDDLALAGRRARTDALPES